MSVLLSFFFRLFFVVLSILWVTHKAQADERIYGLCAAASELAKVIMNVRQSGVEMSEAIAIANEFRRSEGFDVVSDLAESYAVSAYAYPIVRDEGVRREIVGEFGNYAYTACFKLIKSSSS